jgi:hypothetical protein
VPPNHPQRGRNEPHSAALANGVVGVRVIWGPEDAGAWREQHAKYDRPSPRVYLASLIIDRPNPTWTGTTAVADAAQARAAVDRYQANGADFIKVYDRVPKDGSRLPLLYCRRKLFRKILFI